jgi:hypothetical protein
MTARPFNRTGQRRLKRDPKISILHPTARPELWGSCCHSWFDNCDHPEDVEYVLVPERSRFATLDNLHIPFPKQIITYNTYKENLVGANNRAAECSHGDILVCVADRYMSSPHWDTLLLQVLEARVGTEAVVWAHQNARDEDLMVHAILTRPYYRRLGYVYNPAYTDWFADNEFQEVAQKDGVIIDARHILKFNKTVPINDELENQYERHGDISKAVYEGRKAAGFPRG